MTVKNIYQSFAHKMAAKASWHRNYVTVTLCICNAGMYNVYGLGLKVVSFFYISPVRERSNTSSWED